MPHAVDLIDSGGAVGGKATERTSKATGANAAELLQQGGATRGAARTAGPVSRCDDVAGEPHKGL